MLKLILMLKRLSVIGTDVCLFPGSVCTVVWKIIHNLHIFCELCNSPLMSFSFPICLFLHCGFAQLILLCHLFSEMTQRTISWIVLQFSYTLMFGVFVLLICLKICQCLSVVIFFNVTVLSDSCVFAEDIHHFFFSPDHLTHIPRPRLLFSCEPSFLLLLDPFTNTQQYTVNPISLILPLNHTSHIYPFHDK